MKTSFRALTVVQTLGAFNDNVFKYAILLLANATGARFSDESFLEWIGVEPKALVLFVFSLPFVLFGAFAGGLADRFPKPRQILLLKGTEIALMAFGAAAFLTGNASTVFVILFLMGAQSAFFGPNKYGVIPEMLPETELSRGNAVIQGTTYAAIIGGTLAGAELIQWLGMDFWWVGVCCVGIAGVGWVAACFITPLPAADPARRPPLNFVRSFWRDMAKASRDRELLVALLLGALFLHVAGLLVSSIVDYVEALAPDEAASMSGRLQGLMGVGIVLGSLLVGKLSGDRVESGLVPFGAAGVSLCLAGLAMPGVGVGAAALLLLGSGVSAGVYLVPLRALIQARPDPAEKGRFMGAAQVLDFTALLGAAAVFHVMVRVIGLSPREQMLTIGIMTAVGALALFSASERYYQGALRLLRKVQPGRASNR